MVIAAVRVSTLVEFPDEVLVLFKQGFPVKFVILPSLLCTSASARLGTKKLESLLSFNSLPQLGVIDRLAQAINQDVIHRFLSFQAFSRAV